MALAALTGLNLLNYLDRYVLPAVVTPLERDLGLNDSQFGTVVTAFMAGYFLTAPIFGFLGDRLPRKWLVAAGILVWSIGSILSGRAHGMLSLILFRVLVGLGEASYGTASPAWIADLYPPARRNSALSLFYVAIPVGSALGFIVGGAMASHFGWRWAFVWAGAPGLLLALGLLALPEPARGACEPEAPAEGNAGGMIAPLPASGFRGGFRTYASLARIRDYRLVVLGYVAQTFALGGFGIWAAKFLEEKHHMKYADADRFFGIALVVAGLVATLAGGWTATAWRRRYAGAYAWVLGLSAAAAVPASFLAVTVADLGLAKAALVAAMFLLFLSTGPVNTLILETVPLGMRASAMAASIFAIHLLGDLISPKIVGILSTRFGDLQKAILWTLPEAIVVCAIFWLWLAFSPSPAAPRPRSAGDSGERTH